MHLSKHLGFYLLELLISFLLSSTCIMIGYQALKAKAEKRHALATLNHLEQSISNARHLALTHHQAIYICPTKNLKTCQSGHWQNGVLIFNAGHILQARKFQGTGYLQLFCFGKRKEVLKIERDGTTYQNGHFSYRLEKNKAIKLIFNRFFRFRLAL